jgi:hypothetical protein
MSMIGFDEIVHSAQGKNQFDLQEHEETQL